MNEVTRRKMLLGGLALPALAIPAQAAEPQDGVVIEGDGWSVHLSKEEELNLKHAGEIRLHGMTKGVGHTWAIFPNRIRLWESIPFDGEPFWAHLKEGVIYKVRIRIAGLDLGHYLLKEIGVGVYPPNRSRTYTFEKEVS